MSLKQRIQDDMKAALRSGDKTRLGTLRQIKAKFQEREVELRAARGIDYAIEDDEAIAVLTRAAKQRRESIESFRAGNRPDLVAREEAELGIIEGYLPERLGDDELRRLVREAIAESGATGARDLGAVMKAVMPKVRGRADGKEVNRVARELLGG